MSSRSLVKSLLPSLMQVRTLGGSVMRRALAVAGFLFLGFVSLLVLGENDASAETANAGSGCSGGNAVASLTDSGCAENQRSADLPTTDVSRLTKGVSGESAVLDTGVAYSRHVQTPEAERSSNSPEQETAEQETDEPDQAPNDVVNSVAEKAANATAPLSDATESATGTRIVDAATYHATDAGSTESNESDEAADDNTDAKPTETSKPSQSAQQSETTQQSDQDQSGSDGVADLGSVTDPIAGVTETVAKPITSVTAPIARTVETTAEPIAEPVNKTVQSLSAPVTKPIRSAVSGPVSSVTKAVTDPVEKAAAPIVSITKPVTDAARPVLDPVQTAVAPVAEPVLEPVRSLAVPVIDTADEIAQPLQPVTTPIVAPVSNSVQQALAPIAQPAADAVATATQPLMQGVNTGVVPPQQPAEKVPAPTGDVQAAAPQRQQASGVRYVRGEANDDAVQYRRVATKAAPPAGIRTQAPQQFDLRAAQSDDAPVTVAAAPSGQDDGHGSPSDNTVVPGSPMAPTGSGPGSNLSSPGNGGAAQGTVANQAAPEEKAVPTTRQDQQGSAVRSAADDPSTSPD